MKYTTFFLLLIILSSCGSQQTQDSLVSTFSGTTLSGALEQTGSLESTGAQLIEETLDMSGSIQTQTGTYQELQVKQNSSSAPLSKEQVSSVENVSTQEITKQLTDEEVELGDDVSQFLNEIINGEAQFDSASKYLDSHTSQ